MRLKIRYKLILAISILVIVLFGIASSLFIQEKKVELADDIFLKMLSFSRLTAPIIADSHDLYLEQSSFVYFNRDIAQVFQQNEDLGRLKIVSFDGQLKFDSKLDLEEQYVGDDRFVDDESVLKGVKSENVFVLTEESKSYFLKFDLDGGFEFVDENETIVEGMEPGSLLNYVLVPANERLSILFEVDYSDMYERLERMRMRIIYLALFGVMLGVMMSLYMSNRITKPIDKLVSAVEKIAQGDFEVRVDIKSGDEIKVLGDAFNKMAMDLEKSIEAKVYKERVAAELDLAIKIQDQLIPDEEPPTEGVDISASIDPAGEIGGDIYDFIKLPDGRLLTYVGDVTGHGVPAGIISSISSALFYGFAYEADLTKIIVNVNRVLKAKTMPTMFLTLCLMSWDPNAKKFHYSSAGHEQIVHYIAAEDRVELKAAGGIALGMLPDVSTMTKAYEVPFNVGDFMIVYSDGIPEAWRSQEECYGMERLQTVAKKFAKSGDANAIREAILADLTAFRNGYEQMDDITIMVIKRV